MTTYPERPERLETEQPEPHKYRTSRTIWATVGGAMTTILVSSFTPGGNVAGVGIDGEPVTVAWDDVREVDRLMLAWLAEEQAEPLLTITINRTFGDGSTLSLVITGAEARHYYYRYLFPILQRDAG